MTTEFSFTQEIYFSAIEKYKKIYSKVPSIREIARLVGVSSPGTVYGVLKRMKAKGYDYKKYINNI